MFTSKDIKPTLLALRDAQVHFETLERTIPTPEARAFASQAADHAATALKDAPGFPCCFFCDITMSVSDNKHFTTRGNPVCTSCHNEIEEHKAQRSRAFVRELAGVIMEPWESRSSNLLREAHVNIHD